MLCRLDHVCVERLVALTDQKFDFLGYQRHWNAAACAPWLHDPATGTFIAYDDERTVREKAGYVKARGLRGAMFWEISADHQGDLAAVLAGELGR